MFHIATEEDIKAGRVTDVYFQRTLEVLKAKGIRKRVVAEVCAKALPVDWKWALFAGVEECLELLRGRPVNLSGLKEGTVFHPFEPVLEIEGYYEDFALFETAILGFICQASGIASAAARCRKAAGHRPVISFGARRMHPVIAPMIERSAFLGGCDGVAVMKNAEFLGIEPTGTMPHAFILLMGDTVEATKAFDEVIPKEVARVSLIDTFQDEKFAAIDVARALGEHLYAVRLDTPASRRGNFLQILEEVRWELNLRGFQKVKLFVSGNIEADAMPALNPVVDGYGVGTYISNAPVIDFSLDIVEIEGDATAKRGKSSGRKSLWRCTDCFRSGLAIRGTAARLCDCGGEAALLSTELIRGGLVVTDCPHPREIKEYVLEQLPHCVL
jgi:nicotinate phosphoribosyltransferase